MNRERNMEDKRYWLALNMVPGVGPIAYRNLVGLFRDPERVFAASPKALAAVEGIGEKTISGMSIEKLPKMS